MCELWCRANTPINVTVSLAVFGDHSGPYGDGWGIAYQENEILGLSKSRLVIALVHALSVVAYPIRRNWYGCQDSYPAKD